MESESILGDEELLKTFTIEKLEELNTRMFIEAWIPALGVMEDNNLSPSKQNAGTETPGLVIPEGMATL